VFGVGYIAGMKSSAARAALDLEDTKTL